MKCGYPGNRNEILTRFFLTKNTIHFCSTFDCRVTEVTVKTTFERSYLKMQCNESMCFRVKHNKETTVTIAIKNK